MYPIIFVEIGAMNNDKILKWSDATLLMCEANVCMLEHILESNQFFKPNRSR